MARIVLTDKFVKGRPGAAPGERDSYRDALVPGLALRVTDTGHRSFVLTARYPSNPKNPTRRALGDYPATTLEQARVRAREWLEMIQRGVDPRVEKVRAQAAAARAASNTFAHVAEEFLARAVKGPAWVEIERRAAELRQTAPGLTMPAAIRAVVRDPGARALVERSRREGITKRDEAERILRRDFIKRWGPRPISDIRPEEAATAVRSIVKRGTLYEAHNGFGHLRRLFRWAIGTGEFGLSASPVAGFSPADLIGRREARDRILTDDELRAVWNACGGPAGAEALLAARRRDRPQDRAAALGYPYGPVVRLLILTGQRLHEVADMRWSEVDLDGGMWTIPAARMKGGRAHQVPLAPDALALLAGLPRWGGGDHVFSTTDGRLPVNGFSKTKERLDARSGVAEWRLHDLRRTVRTNFSALPGVSDMVRELVIAHARPGLHRVYDLHSYVEEKRDCLVKWEARLRGILNPVPAEAIDIAAARGRRREVAVG